MSVSLTGKATGRLGNGRYRLPDGSGYELSEDRVLRELGISETTLLRYQERAGPLEGEPLVCALREVAGAWEKRYPEVLIRRIKEAYEANKRGRYTDKDGRLWLDDEQTLRELRPHWKTLTKQTVSAWRNDGCVHLPNGRTLTAELKQLGREPTKGKAWNLAADVLIIKDSLRDLAQGRYGPAEDPCLTVTAAARALGRDIETIRRREKNGILNPVYFPNKRGAWPQGPLKKTFRLSDLKASERARPPTAQWRGIHGENPETRRLNIRAAAKLLGRKYRWTLTLFEKHGLPMKKMQPPGERKKERTVLEKDVLALKDKLAAERSRSLPEGNWKSAKEISVLYGITKNRFTFRQLLHDLRESGRLAAHQVFRKRAGNRGRTFWTAVWYYDADRFAELLAGRDILDLAKRLRNGEGEQPVPSGAPPVILKGFGENPTVLGHEKPPLSLATYDTVEALIKAGDAGLNKDELDWQSGHTEARKYLKALAAKDSDWRQVIEFPGKSWGRYRIRTRADL